MTSIIVFRIGAIRDGDNQLMDSTEKVCLRVIASSTYFGLEVLTWCHIRQYKQNRTKESKLQPSQPLLTTLWIIVGQVRVVLIVVTNAPSLSLKNKDKESNYNHQPLERRLCVNALDCEYPH